jgi:hypothetical protein
MALTEFTDNPFNEEVEYSLSWLWRFGNCNFQFDSTTVCDSWSVSTILLSSLTTFLPLELLSQRVSSQQSQVQASQTEFPLPRVAQTAITRATTLIQTERADIVLSQSNSREQEQLQKEKELKIRQQQQQQQEEQREREREMEREKIEKETKRREMERKVEVEKEQRRREQEIFERKEKEKREETERQRQRLESERIENEKRERKEREKRIQEEEEKRRQEREEQTSGRSKRSSGKHSDRRLRVDKIDCRGDVAREIITFSR